jgi:hypothetical protein
MVARVQEQQVTLATATNSHHRIREAYTRTVQELATLKKNIETRITASNQDEMFFCVIQATEMENRLESAFNRLNDKVLTFYPTAKIKYGKACIGPQIAPFIEGANPKLVEALTKWFEHPRNPR